MRQRTFISLLAACTVCGCSSAVHRLPQISDASRALAQAEVQAAAAPVAVDTDEEDAAAAVRAAVRRLQRPGGQVCREMNVGVCDWHVRVSDDPTLNAGAGARGLIVVNRGVVDYATSEEEICLVIAHEMGHQAANHVRLAERNRTMGAVLGAVLAGAAVAVASRGAYDGAYVTQTAMQYGAEIGAGIGGVAYSKEQEREADYLAALILYRAGVDLDKARGMLVTLARLSGKTITGLFDTHPAGPERIAGWDRAVAEIRASNGRLPPRA